MRSALFVVALLLVGCEGAPATNVGSNTNWLKSCDEDQDCAGALACHCGTCTLACNADSDCSTLEGARCSPPDEPAVWATCATREPVLGSGICLPACEPGDCGSAQACVAGACVPAAVPAGDFCAPVATPDVGDRAREDELLALLQALRVNGVTACDGATPAPAVLPLRFDTRLLCAARVLASDLEDRMTLGLIDSSGRSTPDRLALAGYSAGPWGESYARGTSTATVLDGMLSDLDSCERFVDATFLDVGVGSRGDVSIITIATE